MKGGTPPLAVARVVGLVTVSVGLALGATYLPAPISLAKGTSPARAAAPHAEPVTLTRLVCPGPQARGVEGLPDSPGQAVSVLAATAPATSLPAAAAKPGGNGSLTISGLPPGGAWPAPVAARGQVVSGQVATAQSALVAGAGALAPGTVATQWSWTKTGNGRGLVTAACVPATVSSWLTAGGAAPGRLEHLVLANPGLNPVTVDLSIFGVNGRIDSPAGQGLVVAGQARTVILLDAIAGSEPSPVVHVTARGGKVAAVLSETWLDGLVPRGGDDVVSQAPPSREQVIAGVPINGRAVVRVAVAQDSEAIVQLRLLTLAGPKPLPASGVSRVAGRSTKDIDLGPVPPGAYAVQVRADVPVVAAVMVDRRRAAGGPSELAWSAASLPIRTLVGMALPAATAQGLTERLDLAATAVGASVRVTTVAAGGQVSVKDVAIGADSVSVLPVDGAASVWVTPVTGTVRGAVLTSASDAGGALLSVAPLTDLTLTSTPLALRQLPG